MKLQAVAVVLHLSLDARPVLIIVDGINGAMYLSFMNVANDENDEAATVTYNGEIRDLVELWREIAEWNPIFRIAKTRDWSPQDGDAHAQ